MMSAVTSLVGSCGFRVAAVRDEGAQQTVTNRVHARGRRDCSVDAGVGRVALVMRGY